MRLREDARWHHSVMSVSVPRPAAAFAQLARTLAETGGILPTLHEVVASAVEMVPCDWAAAAVAEHLTSRPAALAATTDEVLMATVADIAGRVGTSPGITAFGTGGPVYSPDLCTEDRFGDYGPQMVARTPIRSVLSLGLRMHETTLGVMTLYAARRDAFDASAVERATLLGDHAAVAIEAARNVDRADNLEVALVRSRTIGTAVGILVERHRLLPDQAFDVLRVASQNTNCKLADLAEQLIETGALPESCGVDAGLLDGRRAAASWR